MCPVQLHWEKAPGSLLLVSSSFHPTCPLSLLIFALYSFGIIHLTHESPTSPRSESVKLEVVLGTLTQEVKGDVGREGKCGKNTNKIL